MRRKILVVEDNPDQLDAIRMTLKQAGLAVGTATNGIDALKKANSLSPDLIILDVMMPDVDGGTIAADLAETQDLNHVPVVFLTAIVTKEEAGPTGSSIGGRILLAKPVNLKNLITCIENHISK